MRDTLESLSTLAGEELGGEQLVAASPFAPKGWIKAQGLKTAASIRPSLLLTMGTVNTPAGNAIADDALPDNLILALGTTRVFIFELSTKIARASELKAIVPLSSITEVTTRRYKQFPMMKMLSLDMSLEDGSRLTLEIGGTGMKDGQRFVDALTAAVTTD